MLALITCLCITPVCIYRGIWVPEATNVVPLRFSSEDLQVTVLANGAVFVGQEPVSEDGLEEFLRTKLSDRPDGRISISADRSLPFADLSRVMQSARAAGSRSVFVVAESDPLRMYFQGWQPDAR